MGWAVVGGEAVTACACCGTNLATEDADLARVDRDSRCNRCFLGLCRCQLSTSEQAEADAKIDRLAAEGDRMERDARPWRDEDEIGEGVRDGR
jgi:hypothetical protein